MRLFRIVFISTLKFRILESILQYNCNRLLHHLSIIMTAVSGWLNRYEIGLRIQRFVVQFQSKPIGCCVKRFWDQDKRRNTNAVYLRLLYFAVWRSKGKYSHIVRKYLHRITLQKYKIFTLQYIAIGCSSLWQYLWLQFLDGLVDWNLVL